MTGVEKKLCGITKLEVKRAEFTWTICDYSMVFKKIGEYLSSPLFSISENENVKWSLYLYPSGFDELGKDSIGLFLSMDEADNEFLVKVTLSIVNSQQVPKLSYSHTRLYNPETNSYGYAAFAKKSYIEDAANDLLKDDKLTIICKMRVDMSDLNSIFQKKVLKDDQFNKNIGLLLNNEELTDITLIAQDKEFKVHKAILAAQSPVFMAMFRINMIEKKENQVELTDFNSEVISKMLQYMYTGKVNDLDKQSSDLLKIADKYDIGGLKCMCENILYNKLNVNNAIGTLILADSYNCQELKNDIIQFIIAHKSVIIKSQEFETLKKEKNSDLAIEVLYEIVNSNLNHTQIEEKKNPIVQIN